jgi:hypothetical protein
VGGGTYDREDVHAAEQLAALFGPLAEGVGHLDLLKDARAHVALPVGVHALVRPQVRADLLHADVVLPILDELLQRHVVLVERHHPKKQTKWSAHV